MLQVYLLYAVLLSFSRHGVASVDPNHQAKLRMLQPVHGTVVTAPLFLQASLSAPNMPALFEIISTNATICVEIDHMLARCKPLNVANAMDEVISDVQLGGHSARLGFEFIASERVTFTLVEQCEYLRQMQELQLSQEQPDLLLSSTYKAERIQEPLSESKSGEDGPPLFANVDYYIGSESLLVFGVKTNLADHVAYRQAIRETWANKKNLLPGIEVIFIGCRLNTTSHSRPEYLRAINLERQLYGDLLTDELDCEDSYHALVKKCTEFLRSVKTRDASRLPMYILMVDNEFFVRVNDLAHLLWKYYADQVLAKEFGRPQHPVRDPSHKNYLSVSQYSMSGFPPFVSGVHYVVLIDCARLVPSNRSELEGVGSLDDVSVELWLKSAEVHPLHSHLLRNIYTSNCDINNLVSYTDISVIAFRAIHKNLQSGRSFCRGFNRTTGSQASLSSPREQHREQTHDPLGNDAGSFKTIQLDIAQPVNGTAVRSSVFFRGRIVVRDGELISEYYDNDTAVCVEINGQLVTCKILRDTFDSMVIENVELGSHSARFVLVSSDVQGLMVDSQVKPLASSDLVKFTVVEDDEFRRRLGDLNRLHEPQDLLGWARLQALKRPSATRTITIDKPYIWSKREIINPNPTPAYRANEPEDNSSPLLVIGVKTSVVFGFAYRQAIRETWANKNNLPKRVQVVFVGCRPDASLMTPLIREAIELEKRRFGDLLTHELDCVDRYSQLAKKAKEFLRYVAQKLEYYSPQYVMIADDDIFPQLNLLVTFLHLHAPRSRYYAGQVRSLQFDQVRNPIRDPTHKNYLSETEYPLKQLPPFATGAHYVLSFDCAQFIGINHHELREFGGLDDVSIAYWMLALQVHPVHLPVMKILKADYYDLNDSVISLADLSPTGIREIHENLLHKRHFCHGLNLTSWSRLTKSATATTAMEDLRRDSMNSSNVDFMFTTDVNLDSDTNQLIISTKTQLSLTIETDSVSYCPSTDLFESYCEKVYHGYILIRGEHSSPQTIFCDKLRQQLVQAHSLVHINSARLALWNHNLQTRQGNQPPVLVVYSNRAKYASTVLECLFASVFTDRHALVLNETEFEGYQYQQQLRNQSLTPPDAAVFAVIDGVCDSTWTLECGLPSSDFLHRYGATNATLMMMIAGEPWDVATLDERVLLLSTISARRNRGRHIYLPVASTSFGERMHHSPMRLLTSQGLRKGEGRESGQSRRFCIYLYARCDRPQREYMFDLLDAIEPVDAPGVCQGARHAPDSSRRERRYHAWYNDEAVDMYERYKFVIAFENEQEPGYVTEKLANAFLAGSIPVYLGHSETVTQIFNVKSFIDCGQFRTLRDCADRVQEVHQSPELYAQMRHESAVANVSAFYEAFSWHPDVPSGFLSDELAKYLNFQVMPR